MELDAALNELGVLRKETLFEKVLLADLIKSHLARDNWPGEVFCTDLGPAGEYIRAYPTQWKMADGTVVSSDPVNATGIKITPDMLKLSAGEALQLTAVVTPLGAPQAVTWKSSNILVAEVSSTGFVKVPAGVKIGSTATITGTTPDGLEHSVNLTVAFSGKASRPLLLELGDSFIANGLAASVGFESYGFVTGAMHNSQQRLRRRLDKLFGRGGYNTSQVEKVFIEEVLPIIKQFGLAILHNGTNDGLDLTVDETLAGSKRMRDLVLAEGIPVIFGAPEPRGNDAMPTHRLTGEALSRHLERRRRMVAELPTVGCIVVDVSAKLLKPGTVNDIIDAFSHDGLHPNPRGVDEVWGPAYGTAIMALTDDPLNRPNGTTARSLVQNVEVAGTVSSNSPPAPYTGTNGANTAAVTRTYAEIANARGRWAQCTVGGGAAAEAAGIDLFRQIGLQDKFEIGKTYEVWCEWECDDGVTNLLSLQCGIQTVSASGSTLLWDGDKYVDGQMMSSKAQTGQWFKTPAFTVTEKLTDFRMRLTTYPSKLGPPVGVFRVRNFEPIELVA